MEGTAGARRCCSHQDRVYRACRMEAFCCIAIPPPAALMSGSGCAPVVGGGVPVKAAGVAQRALHGGQLPRLLPIDEHAGHMLSHIVCTWRQVGGMRRRELEQSTSRCGTCWCTQSVAAGVRSTGWLGPRRQVVQQDASSLCPGQAYRTRQAAQPCRKRV